SKRVGMQPGILDAELAHLAAASFGARNLASQTVVLGDHATLLVQCRRFGERHAGSQRANLLKDPWIADSATRYAETIDAGCAKHVDAGLRREQVAAA